MNPTDCPYIECKQEHMDNISDQCPDCGQYLKRCEMCQTANRSFANYCRFCGEKLPGSNMYWTGFKGTPQRTGLNRSIVPNSPPDLNIRELKSIRFPGRCRSILADDGYLVAVSDGGTVKIVNLNQLDTEPYTFVTDGNIYAEPALHNGTLYLGRVKSPDHEKGSIYAYTLGGVSLSTPEVNLRWDMDLKGTPVQALLPFDDRLYLNVGFTRSS